MTGQQIALAGATLDAGGPQGSELASWTPLVVLVSALGLLLLLLAVRGRGSGRPLLGIPARLEVRTGLPGWAATTVLLGLFGLLVAGTGFYDDVAWHVALGRDDALFTAPHTAILVGLLLIAAAPVAGAVVALVDVDGDRTSLSGGAIPASLRPQAVLGVAALTGFPLDEVWHRAFGIDVTMWSPPHLLMILAASASGLGLWVVLADAGVRVTDGRLARGLHLLLAGLTLQGLSSIQGEFGFGVPQWQHLYHPVLFCLAAGVGLVLVRLVHGPGWTLGLATVVFLLQLADSGDLPVDQRAGATYLGAALVVELAAAALGTRRPLRLALAAGVGTATGGLAVEWWWNSGAEQPWQAALLPEAVLVGGLAAVSGAVLAAALSTAIAPPQTGRRALPRAVVVTALVGVVASLAIPAPRSVGDVQAAMTLERADGDRVFVEVVLTPADAADDATWFFAGSWQWGGRTTATMREVSPGRWRSEVPVEVTGRAKALLRLARGDELMALPIRLPADPELGLPALPAVDRSGPLQAEGQYLQREAEASSGPLGVLVPLLAIGLAGLWVLVLSGAVGSVARGQVRRQAQVREQVRAQEVVDVPHPVA